MENQDIKIEHAKVDDKDAIAERVRIRPRPRSLPRKIQRGLRAIHQKQHPQKDIQIPIAPLPHRTKQRENNKKHEPQAPPTRPRTQRQRHPTPTLLRVTILFPTKKRLQRHQNEEKTNRQPLHTTLQRIRSRLHQRPY